MEWKHIQLIVKNKENRMEKEDVTEPNQNRRKRKKEIEKRHEKNIQIEKEIMKKKSVTDKDSTLLPEAQGLNVLGKKSKTRTKIKKLVMVQYQVQISL